MILVGSQAIHGSVENPPKDLEKSNEVDLWIPNDPERTELVEALFGRKSQFEITHGYRQGLDGLNRRHLERSIKYFSGGRGGIADD